MGHSKERRPEIVIGLAGAIGSPLDKTASVLELSLKRFGYLSTAIKLSGLLRDSSANDVLVFDQGEAQRIESHMDGGNRLRQIAGRGDALILMALAIMGQRRRAEAASEEDVAPPIAGHAFILKSLKHPDEVATLRQLYGEQFVLIGVHSPRERRVADLTHRLADAGTDRADLRAKAEVLIARDEKEDGAPYGQNLRDVYPQADAFVRVDNLEGDVDRFLDLLFGCPSLAPRPDEQGMFFAQAAALRSTAMARQVGACITSPTGDVIAVGCNEVPAAGGGQYWSGEPGDQRDIVKGADQSDRLKRRALTELFGRFAESKWLADDVRDMSVPDLVSAVIQRKEGAPLLSGTILTSLTEFGRDMHAEMAALMTLVRLPLSGLGAILYCTTFPCHSCAKHIIGAGIARVVYIEPYPKSYASELHGDAISSDNGVRDKLPFEAFSGIAPRRYDACFRHGSRKESDGQAKVWDRTSAAPVFATPERGRIEYPDLSTESALIALYLQQLLAPEQPKMDSSLEGENMEAVTSGQA